jgi:hypothetical protein
MIDRTTVVLTACGRPDLLAHTLQTLNACHPLADFAEVWVNEDEPATDNSATKDLFPFVKWTAPTGKGGHMAALNRLYGQVRTPWIFHCEDDWEFYGGEFLKESYLRLNTEPRCLQVWLRAHNDTNDHRIKRTPTGLIMALDGHPPARGRPPRHVWRGFSLNPGLRRAKEFAAFDFMKATVGLSGWRAEQRIGEHFYQRGYHAAITSNPLGYVRHTGDGRHKEDQAG